ncbi:MAG: anti-sigma factor family protein, partial [Planctomycetota bacterium]
MTHPGTTRLQRYALGELDAEARLELEQHFAECEDCARLAGAERRLDEWIVQTSAGALPHGAARATFDRLWAEVDEAPADAALRAEPARVARPWWLRRLPRVAAAAALVLVALVLWQWLGDDDAVADIGRDNGPVATKDGAPDDRAPPVLPDEPAPAVEQPAHDVAEIDVRLVTEGDDLDLQLLAQARDRVAETLVREHGLRPDDDVAFMESVRAEFAALEGEGWSIAHLVRGHALGGREALGAAALRYAVLDPGSTATLAMALERPELTPRVLALLAEHPVPLDDSPRLARALARVVGRRHDQPLSADGVVAADLLARDGGAAQLADLLGDAVERAAGRSPPD